MNIASTHEALIQWIRDNTDISDSMLHVHAGMTVLVAARVMTRLPLTDPRPILIVVLAAVANEILNRASWGTWRLDDSLPDLMHTIMWPTILFVALRISRYSTRRRATAIKQHEPG